MKIAQTECEKRGVAKHNQHQHQRDNNNHHRHHHQNHSHQTIGKVKQSFPHSRTLATVAAPAAAQTVGSNSGTNENARNNNNAAAAAKATKTKTTTAAKMTDERNSSEINTNNRIIAEAAKILLNGLNGTLLSSSATFQLPAPPPPLPQHQSSNTRLTSLFEQPLTAHGTSAAAKVNSQSPRRGTFPNNGLASSSTASSLSSSPKHKGTKTMSTTTTTLTTAEIRATSPPGMMPGTLLDEGGGGGKTSLDAIDYTVSDLTANSHRKHGISSNDTGRTPTSLFAVGSNAAAACGNGSYAGGRLQFFKDGKFILELARSKEAGRGGWVSVPRKTYRPSSASSSTIATPISTYPKNESSTSLSFSDDNSSLQSSPWQRDHCWKQSNPRRCISVEMSLFYQRPQKVVLSPSGLLAARHKRRRPYDAGTYFTDGKIFAPKANKLKFELKEEKVEMKEEVSKPPDCDTLSSKSNSTENRNDENATVRIPDIKTIKAMKEEKELGNNDESSHKAEKKIDEDTDDENASKMKVESCSETEDAVMPDSSKKDPPSEKTVTNSVKEEQNNAVDLNKKTEKGGKENRLKTRAKLTAIVQKLIDRMPTRQAQLSRTTHGAASGGSPANYSGSNIISNKISPPSTSASATSRLVVEYHQQHVSPRKRILREFEKVSLEENAATGASGGKRSRAKISTTTQRVQSNVNNGESTIATQTTAAQTPNGNHHSTSVSVTKSKASTPSTSSSTPPTRLYSSYSINSLLGGSTSSSSKRASDPAVISSIGSHSQQHQQLHQFADPSYLRAMLASPKSPESSNSSIGVPSKRPSPPYASPKRDKHCRSPSAQYAKSEHMGRRSPRATPPDTNNYKSHLSADQSLQSQQNHQTIFSHYMMSPKYAPPSTGTSIAVSPNSNQTASQQGRSPRQLSAFRSTSPNAGSTLTHHIPNSSNSGTPLGMSPQRPQNTVSPRESTPRTVPKKTASIRRQFATSINNNNNNNNSPSPSDRVPEDVTTMTQQGRQTPVSSSAQHLLPPNVVSNVAARTAAVASPLPYYFYPPPPNSPASPVVPPAYYHPYLSTLAALRHNSMWAMHHYAGGMLPHHPATSSAFHPNFPFNGLNAVAVAAAAAAGFGGDNIGAQATNCLPTSHMPPSHAHHHMLPPLSAPHGDLIGHTSSAAARKPSPKSTDSSAYATDNKHSTPPPPQPPHSAFTSSIRDEHSSDLPLNLSKH